MSKESSGSSVGLTGLIFCIFLVLKLTDVINWSWLWVTAPLWIPAGIVVLIILVVLIRFFIK